MKLLSYLALVAGLQGLAFAAIVFFLNPKATLNRLGAVLGLLNAWWNLCLMFVYGSNDLSTALFFDRLSYVAVLGLNPVLGWFYLKLADASPRVIVGLLAVACVAEGLVAWGYLTAGFPRAAFQPGPWGNVGILAADQGWSTVSDVTAIGLDLVYFAVLARKRVTTPSWRLKRLIGLLLLGIVLIIAAYLVLELVTQSFGIPSLIFLPAALLTGLVLYVIAQHRFLQPEQASLERHLAEALTQPALLLDTNASIIGANASARALLGPEKDPIGQGLTTLLDDPETFQHQWSEAKARRPEGLGTLETSLGPVRLSPHFDRFGDFVGAVALFDDASSRSQGSDNLSDRETEVLNLVMDGIGNQAIADQLFVSLATVKSHVHSILTKTGARGRQELLRRFRGLKTSRFPSNPS